METALPVKLNLLLWENQILLPTSQAPHLDYAWCSHPPSTPRADICPEQLRPPAEPQLQGVWECRFPFFPEAA